MRKDKGIEFEGSIDQLLIIAQLHPLADPLIHLGAYPTEVHGQSPRSGNKVTEKLKNFLS